VTATIASAATLELAGTVSGLSSAAAADRANVVNNSQAAGGGLLVSGTNQQVGSIDGIGNTVVSAAATVTANHIAQNALIIEGTAGQPGIVTVAASDSSGNPLTEASAIASVTDLPFGTSSFDIPGIAGNGDSSFGSGRAAASGGLSASVPEPSALLLLSVAILLAGASAKASRAISR
jgi:hypothetical protein